MNNQYPMWKYLLIALVLLGGALYALPNLFGDSPALQISPGKTTLMSEQTATKVASLLDAAGLAHRPVEKLGDGLLVRFADPDTQLRAKQVVSDGLGNGYNIALNLAPDTPAWLASLGAKPMSLGLDLRGGVHFLMQVDADAAIANAIERYVSDIRDQMREEKVRYLTIINRDNKVEVRFRDADEMAKAEALIHASYRALALKGEERDGAFFLTASMAEKERLEELTKALKQNITTLRNRINEIGVAEPIIQQQGADRIVVQLPGIQDTARAKELLGATATLEYRMVDEEHDVRDALNGHVPPGSRIYYERDGSPILLQKQVIVTGDQIIDAASGIDSHSSAPMVSVTLDGKGARKMDRNTKDNVGKRMAVVFIETITETKTVDGVATKEKRIEEKVISVAVIRERFSKRFQTTGLDNPQEAHTLALLLRAGALAAPLEIVEERTVGPSLGQNNIDQGKLSVAVGFFVVMLFMGYVYKGFGMVANLALALNVVLIVAALSLLQATLTLPGIAGIVLTVGMAVDANVLIFERIREEMRVGTPPHSAIRAGYEKAFSTIADANITTLIAAVVLFSFGTGPIKGFAITLTFGIITSMFTAIMVTRAVIALWLGNKRLKALSI